MEHLTNGGTEYYHLLRSRTRTRGEQIYVKLRTEIGHKPCGSPATVTFLDETSVRLLDYGPPLASGPSQPADFWTYLRTLGGEWMWDGIVDEQQDLQWLIEGVKSNTIIGVTDGSYDRKVAQI